MYIAGLVEGKNAMAIFPGPFTLRYGQQNPTPPERSITVDGTHYRRADNGRPIKINFLNS